MYIKSEIQDTTKSESEDILVILVFLHLQFPMDVDSFNGTVITTVVHPK